MKLHKVAFFTFLLSLLMSTVVFANAELHYELMQDANLVYTRSWSYEVDGAIVDVTEKRFEVAEVTDATGRAIQPRMSMISRTYNITDAWTSARIATFDLELFFVSDRVSVAGINAFSRTLTATPGVNWHLGSAWFTNNTANRTVTASTSYSFRNSQGSTTTVTISDLVARP